MNLGGKDDLQEGISMRIVSSPNFKGADVEQMREVMGQPTGLDLIKVATSKIEEGVLGLMLVDWIRDWRRLGLVL